jgi:DNA-binding NarL/FixJ family response regulator
LQNVHQLGDAADEKGVFSKLTENELTFLKLACSEKTYFEIAKDMFLSERTIDGYRDAIFKKLNVTTRVGMALYAVKNGLVNL